MTVLAAHPNSLSGLLAAGSGLRPPSAKRSPRPLEHRRHRPPARRARAIARPLPVPPPNSGAVTLQFDDNALLPLLYGEHDRHLARIEQRLGIRLGVAAATG